MTQPVRRLILDQEMDLIKTKLDEEVKQKVGFKSEWWL
jgi:hypothetical protein